MTEPLNITNHRNRPGAAGPDGPNRDQVPQTRAERDRLHDAVCRYVARAAPVPPLSIRELETHADRVLADTGADDRHAKWLAVLVSNEAWRERLATVPFDRRLLLLPKCLRAEGRCEGAIDELGLLCADCGRCPIHDFKDEAERIGYVVLVAEGTAPVMHLIETGRIEAVVGVSCLSALEVIYPLMAAAAVPGIAIPLLYDGCIDTAVDRDWVWDAMHLTGGAISQRLDMEALRRRVDGWFTPEALERVLGPAGGQTERIAREWLSRSGKRWRPLLAVCTYQAFQPTADTPMPETVRRVALAVECFHKASLVHDDIEDGDQYRYGQPCLHEQFGVPVALNVGDFLLGEGYRLIAEAGFDADRTAAMLTAAAHGHRDLTIGQGAELCWARRPEPLSVAQVLDIFRRKTAPAFEVALRLGAVAAGAGDEVWNVLHAYSEALGIAYQIADDIKDLYDGTEPNDLAAMRPSILLAIAHQRAEGADRNLFDALWCRRADVPPDAVRRRFRALGVETEARRLMAEYDQQAVRSLEPLTRADLKGLLRRIVFRIFQNLPQGTPDGDA
ncbi:MAG: polyprenyl synthetase family protein [Planctomycetes bacterium]|nr:polyprenyl synthetase family protein [Planctomycetota bacterium]